MPRGPNGEKRPADAIGLAVMIGKIATGEIEDEREKLSSAAAEMGRKGGEARARSLNAAERTAIAMKGAKARWQKDSPAPAEKERS